MYNESSYIQLSSIQHYLYCPRQCALAYMEMLWSDNLHTSQGKHFHKKADEGKMSVANGVRVERSLPLYSDSLGLSGLADVVEFYEDGQIIPVEYKKGNKKADKTDKAQLCAQAICLEEMLNTDISFGYIFYGKAKRRLKVVFEPELRNLTLATITKIHEIMESGITPKPVFCEKCKSCSLSELCMPEAASKFETVSEYIKEIK